MINRVSFCVGGLAYQRDGGEVVHAVVFQAPAKGGALLEVQQAQPLALSDEDGPVKGCDFVIAEGHLQSRGAGSIQHAVAGGAFGTHGFCEAVCRVHLVEMTGVLIISVGAVDEAAAVACTGELGAGGGVAGGAAIGQVDGHPGQPLFRLNLGVYCGLEGREAQYGYGTGLADRLAVRTGVYGGGGDLYDACGQGCHQAIGVYGGDGVIAGAPDDAAGEGGGLHLGMKLQQVIHGDLRCGLLHAQSQLRGPVVLVQGDGGPNIGAKISQLGDQEPLGIYGVQVGGVASGVGRQQQVPGFLIIKQGTKRTRPFERRW